MKLVLNKGFVNGAGQDLFPKALVHLILMLVSNHVCLFLEFVGMPRDSHEWGKRSFQFEMGWTKDEVCTKVIGDTRKDVEILDLGGVQTLRDVYISKLRGWNRDSIKDIQNQLLVKRKQLKSLQGCIPTRNNIGLRLKVEKELNNLLEIEESW